MYVCLFVIKYSILLSLDQAGEFMLSFLRRFFNLGRSLYCRCMGFGEKSSGYMARRGGNLNVVGWIICQKYRLN